MNSSKKINVNIPVEIQNNIDAGNYSINGSLVRDKLGRIVCHLKSLEAEEDQYFSPNIFVSIQNYAITSVSIVSNKLQNELKKIRDDNKLITKKLDRLLANQANALISSITNFEEHFNNLRSGSSLTNQRETFATGTKAASELAAHIPSYIDEYLGNIQVYHRDSTYDGEKYSDFLERDSKYRPKITKSNFSNFADSEARYFICAFLNIINNINILSLCFDSKVYSGYEDNLQQVRTFAVDLIMKVVEGLEGDIDIFAMSYRSNSNGYYFPLKNIDSLLKCVNYDIHSLINREFSKDTKYYYDENRIKSMYEILRIINDIDNLLNRKDQLSEINLNGLTELNQIKKITFENN